MDARFQPSFIPKAPLAQFSQGRTGTISVLYVVASIVFIVVLGLVGAIFITKRTLEREITALDQDLVNAKASFELSTIEELKKVSARTSIANTLLDKHLAVSKFFERLNETTYTNVAFSSFEAESATDGSVEVTLVGRAGGFNSLILQQNLFDNLAFLQDPLFSNFSLDEEGNVSFTFNAVVDSGTVSYKRYITEP